MGTKCAPAYANIEEKHIYLFIKQISMLYLIFIDDMFMIWTKSENERKIFMKDLNTKHPSIKFDFKYSKNKIEFLDTLVYIDQHQKLQTSLYQKPTDSQNYLHANSKHPCSFKKSIPYSQALRIKRVCSKFQEYVKHSQALIDIQKLVGKGYDEKTIKTQIERADIWKARVF